MKIALLFGGGKESLLSLHTLRKTHKAAEIFLIHFNYGQRSYSKEKESGEYYAHLYKGTYKGYEVTPMLLPESMTKGYNMDNHVPARNMILLGHAINIAISVGIDTLVVPFTTDTISGSDSTQVYLKKLMHSLGAIYPAFSIFSNIKCTSSTTHLYLISQKIDLSHVWSCDNNMEKHCGKCFKCVDFINKVPNNHSYLKKVYYGR